MNNGNAEFVLSCEASLEINATKGRGGLLTSHLSMMGYIH